MGKPKFKLLTDSFRVIKTKLDQTSVRQWALGVLVLIGLYGILSINIAPGGYFLQVGEVARQDIRVPRDIENRAQTEREREKAAVEAEVDVRDDINNYIVNHATIIKVDERLTSVLDLITQFRLDNSQEKEVETEIGDEDGVEGLQAEASNLQKQLTRNAEVILTMDMVEKILAADGKEYSDFGQEIRKIILEKMNEGISKEGLIGYKEELGVIISQSLIVPELQEAAKQISLQIAEPSLVLDQTILEQKRLAAINSVKPILVQAGEIIISDGTVVQPRHVQLLKDLGLYRDSIDYWALFGLLIIVGLLLTVFGISLGKYRRNIIASENKLAFVGSTLVVVAFITKVLSFANWALIQYLTPIALAGILITMLLDSRTGLLTVVALTIVSGIIFQSLPLVVQGLLGGLIAIICVSRVSQRGELMRAGFIVGVSGFLVMIGFGLLYHDRSLIIHSYLGLLNGVLSSIIAIGSLPYFESIFGMTSAIRLLELSNPNQPLLRRLLMETPGTYHHSILVGNLAEAAAEALGADGLLARVGSTYHDIGKLKRPYFFVENQLGIDNPHDKIAPSLSTLIITAHVKDGIELAREHKLPPVITQFIAEHHGTNLINYFYHRALENNGATVEEKDYRYPGPKPQTKETAIVSLADAVEAAVRSLTKSTPSKIEGLVRKIIRERLDDGQLDECDLSFKDLNKLADAFTKVLLGIFHARVEYPEKITREDIEGKRS